MEGTMANKNYIKTLKDVLTGRANDLGLVYNMNEISDTECIINYNNKHTKLVFGQNYVFELCIEVTDNNEVKVHRSSAFEDKKTTSVLQMENATNYIINTLLGAFDDCTYQLTKKDIVKGTVTRLKNRIKEIMKLDVDNHLLDIYDTEDDGKFFIHLKDMNKYLGSYEVKVSDISLNHITHVTINETIMYRDKDDILEIMNSENVDYEEPHVYASQLQVALPKPHEFKNKKEYQIECEHMYDVIGKWISNLKLLKFLASDK